MEKKNLSKKVVCKMLAAAMALSMVTGTVMLPGVADFTGTSITADAAAVALASSGKCGTNATYTFNESTGVLTISGKGEIQESAFNTNQKIKEVNIKSGITVIGTKAFYGCKNLTKVTLPKTVTKISNRAFCNTTALTSVNVLNKDNEANLNSPYKLNLAYIDDYAFYQSGISNLYLPKSLVYIGSRAFENCPNISDELVIPESVAVVGNRAFLNCDKITAINLESSYSLRVIDDYAFYVAAPKSARWLSSSIKLPSTVKFIGTGAFKRNYNEGVQIEPELDNLLNTKLRAYAVIESTSDSVAKTYCTNNKNFLNYGIYEEVVTGDRGIVFKENTAMENKKTNVDTTYTFTGRNINITAQKVSNATYQYYIRKGGTSQWEEFYSDGSAANAASYTMNEAGVYDVKVVISKNDKKSTTYRKVWVEDKASSSDLSVNLSLSHSNKDEISNLNSRLEALPNETLNLKPSVTGGTGTYKYRFLYKLDGEDKWRTIRNTLLNNKVVNFQLPTVGHYQIRVDVMDGYDSEVITSKIFTNVNISDEIESNYNNTSSMQVYNNTITDTTEKTPVVTVNSPVTLLGSADGTDNYEFAYLVTEITNSNDNTQHTIQDFSSSQSAIWTPTKKGTYTVQIRAKNSSGKEVAKEFKVKVNEAAKNVSLANGKTGSSQTVTPGSSVTFTFRTNSGTGTEKMYYNITAQHSNDSKASTVCKYTETTDNTTTYEWTPKRRGVYTVIVNAKDEGGNITPKEFTITVKDTNAVKNTSTASTSNVTFGKAVKFTLQKKSGTGTDKTFYNITAQHSNDSKASTVLKYTETTDNKTIYEWTPKRKGAYTVVVNAKDENGNIDSKTFKITVK